LVGGGAVVNRAILDKNVQIPVGYRVGTDLEADKAQFVMTPDGIPVIPKGWSPTQR
jgi:glucose-1-phosphate adenylyltransferase